jgi:hypothetical protein
MQLKSDLDGRASSKRQKGYVWDVKFALNRACKERPYVHHIREDYDNKHES